MCKLLLCYHQVQFHLDNQELYLHCHQLDLNNILFSEDMLNHIGDSIKGKTVTISGSGNVAQYAAEKCLHLGAKVLTMSWTSC